MLKPVFPTPLGTPFSAAKLKLLTTTIRAPRYNRTASSATLPVMRARTRAKVVNRFFALMFFTFSPLESTPMLLSFWRGHMTVSSRQFTCPTFTSVGFRCYRPINRSFIRFPILFWFRLQRLLVTVWAVVGTDTSFRFADAFLIAHDGLQGWLFC